MSEVIIDLEIVEPILLELEPEQPFKVYPDPSPAILKGDKGDKGDTGEQGIQGEKGDKGDTGEQGIQGEKGDKGDKGDTGEQGIQGEKGDKGDKGDTGEQGIQGEKGEPGEPGQDGQDGADGLSTYQIALANGFEGAEWEWLLSLKGEQGEQGIQGEKGDKGDKGDTGVILLDSHIGGSVTNNILYARLRDILIPANSLNQGDVLEISIMTHVFIGTTKNTRIHLRQDLFTILDDTNVIAASTAGINTTATQVIKREFIYWNENLQALTTALIATDPTGNGTSDLSNLFPFNNSIDNYFTISAGSSNINSFTKTLIRSLVKLIKA